MRRQCTCGASAAQLVLLPAPARTKTVAADLRPRPASRLISVITGLSGAVSMRLEVSIDRREADDDQLKQLLALVGRDRLGPHPRIGIVLVRKHHDRQHRSAMLVAVEQFAPACGPGTDSAQKTLRPGIPAGHVLSIFEQHRQVHVGHLQRAEQRRGDRVPVAYQQAENLVGLLVAFERRVVAPDLWQVFAWQHQVWTADQRRKESLERLEAHRLRAAAARKSARRSNSSSLRASRRFERLMMTKLAQRWGSRISAENWHTRRRKF